MEQTVPTGFIRQRQLLGDPKAEVPIPAIIPVSPGTLWRWVRLGRFPAPLKIGAKVTAWRAEDVRAWIAQQGAKGGV